MKLTVPRHNYLGPGNPLNNGEPVDKDDAIARVHDNEYSVARHQQDIFDSDWKAVKEFGRDFVANSNFHSLLGAAGLGVKTGVERTLGQVLYPSGMSKRLRTNSNNSGEIDDDARQINNEATPEKHYRGVAAGGSPSVSSSAVGDPAQPGPSIQAPPVSAESSGESAISIDGDMSSAEKSSGSMGGGNVMQMWAGSPQEQQWQTRHYHKTYRWTCNSTLPSYQKPAVVTSPTYFKPGSLYNMPVQRVSTFLSPQEFEDLGNFPIVKCNGVSMDIHSLGIRLPFTTASATSVTANASAQYPIVKIKEDFGKYHLLHEDNTQVLDTRSKMIGDTAQNWPASDTFTETFPNLSSRTTSREFTEELIVNMNENAYNATGGGAQRFLNSYGTPNMHEWIETSLNGTTNLGKVFSYSYKPKKNILQTVAVHNLRIGTLATTTANVSGMNMGKQQFQSRDNFAPNLNPTIANLQTMIPAAFQIYENCTVENANVTEANTEWANHRQPPFIVGMQFLRNDDDTLLLAKWEFIMHCSMELSLRTGTTGIYGVDPDLRISMNYYTPWVPGTLGTSGTAATWTYGTQYREANNGVQEYSAAWNKPVGVNQARSAADIAPYPGAPHSTAVAPAPSNNNTVKKFVG